MIRDASALPTGHVENADLCILGGGVAGLTIARELADRDVKVCVLEQGGLENEKEAQRLNRGEVTGYPYWGLDYARHAQLGGASQRWCLELSDGDIGARFRPLDPIDFEKRDGVPNSGWPFSKTELDPFYERAQQCLNLGPNTYAAADWMGDDDELLFEDVSSTKTVVFQYGSRRRFVEAHRASMERASNVTVLLHAHAAEIELGGAGEVVSNVQARTLDGGVFTVQATVYVLALGGIENPRLLLLSNQSHTNGVGNQHDLVGRYFMEHPVFRAGVLWPPDDRVFERDRFYHIHGQNGVSVHGKIALRDEVLRREHLRNFCFMLSPILSPHDRLHESEAFEVARVSKSTLERGYLPDHPFEKMGTFITKSGPLFRFVGREVRRRVAGWWGREEAPVAYSLQHFAEEAPNPNSRVLLSSRKKDCFGQPTAKLDWQLRENDIRDIVRGLEVIKQEVEQTSEWRLDLPEYNRLPPPGIRGGFHHIGTTRMHESPRKGVVNAHGQVHGVPNLFVTGSSVFPTAGYANPTLTIVAMALRLADRLKEEHSW
jgi:choline dehydrogenase-like flavoprotein